VPVLLVHGTRDHIVDIEGSRRLARTGSPDLVRLVEVDDDHRLGSLLVGDRLADLVREVAR
jgi:pimeloyl-ACP methyl ester carboxylesterase